MFPLSAYFEKYMKTQKKYFNLPPIGYLLGILALWTTIYSIISLIYFGYQQIFLSSCHYWTHSYSNRFQTNPGCPCFLYYSNDQIIAFVNDLQTIQTFHLITVAFLLFSSLILLLGLFKKSLYSVILWLITLIATITTSLMYCIFCWNSTEVQDYSFAFSYAEAVFIGFNAIGVNFALIWLVTRLKNNQKANSVAYTIPEPTNAPPADNDNNQHLQASFLYVCD